MNRYLIIDTTPSAYHRLMDKLLDAGGRVFCTRDRADVKRQLASGNVKAVFVDTQLWDHRWFGEVLENGTMPELVLLRKAGQVLQSGPGFGMPEFLTEESSDSELDRVLKYIGSAFIQALDFRFILAKDGDKVYKVDINQISKVEAAENGSLIHTTCGVFVSAQTVSELSELFPRTVVSA